MLTDTQAREAFHFTLLRRLVGQVPEGLRLKGGVNLRLFFGSVRYSEDMDLDADLRLQPRLVDQLQRIIVAPDYRKELLQLGIEDVSTAPSPAKTTDTTLCQATHSRCPVSERASLPRMGQTASP